MTTKMRIRLSVEDLHAEWACQVNRLSRRVGRHSRHAYRAALRREAEAARKLARNARRCA